MDHVRICCGDKLQNSVQIIYDVWNCNQQLHIDYTEGAKTLSYATKFKVYRICI
jgi:hypothetical protein